MGKFEKVIFFLVGLYDALPIANKAGVTRNFELQNCTLNFSSVSQPILLTFSGFEDPTQVYLHDPK